LGFPTTPIATTPIKLSEPKTTNFPPFSPFNLSTTTHPPSGTSGGKA